MGIVSVEQVLLTCSQQFVEGEKSTGILSMTVMIEEFINR